MMKDSRCVGEVPIVLFFAFGHSGSTRSVGLHIDGSGVCLDVTLVNLCSNLLDKDLNASRLDLIKDDDKKVYARQKSYAKLAKKHIEYLDAIHQFLIAFENGVATPKQRVRSYSICKGWCILFC